MPIVLVQVKEIAGNDQKIQYFGNGLEARDCARCPVECNFFLTPTGYVLGRGPIMALGILLRIHAGEAIF